MKRSGLQTVVFTTFVFIVVLAAAWLIEAQEAKSPYPGMAPVDQYLMDRNAEIALARSAAPESISRDAEVMVLGRKGYEIAVQGRNGFVCVVHRSWTSGNNDPEFWNPRRRGPICFNAAAAKSYIPNTIMRTNLVLAGQSKDQIFAAIHAALDKKELPALEPGAMCYMMSKQGYLSDRDGRWHPHLMFFLPPGEAAAWGANLPGSPILADDDTPDRMTVFMVPVTTWSDGTSDSVDGSHTAAMADDISGRHALVLRGRRNATSRSPVAMRLASVTASSRLYGKLEPKPLVNTSRLVTNVFPNQGSVIQEASVCGKSLQRTKKATQSGPHLSDSLTSYYLALAGGTIPFIRRYSTI